MGPTVTKIKKIFFQKKPLNPAPAPKTAAAPTAPTENEGTEQNEPKLKKGTKKSEDKKDDEPPTDDGLPKKPALGNGVAGTHDPNYQTLAGIAGDPFGTDKKTAETTGAGTGAGGTAGPKPPAVGGMAGTHDPNYQVKFLVGSSIRGDFWIYNMNISLDTFVSTPYFTFQTLAGVGGDCFGADKAGGGAGGATAPGGTAGPKPPAAGGMAGIHDPNYQVTT